MMAFRPVAKTFLFFISFVIVISIKKLSNVHKFCYVLVFFFGFFWFLLLLGGVFWEGGGVVLVLHFKEGKSSTSSSSFSFYR